LGFGRDVFVYRIDFSLASVNIYINLLPRGNVFRVDLRRVRVLFYSNFRGIRRFLSGNGSFFAVCCIIDFDIGIDIKIQIDLLPCPNFF